MSTGDSMTMSPPKTDLDLIISVQIMRSHRWQPSRQDLPWSNPLYGMYV